MAWSGATLVAETVFRVKFQAFQYFFDTWWNGP